MAVAGNLRGRAESRHEREPASESWVSCRQSARNERRAGMSVPRSFADLPLHDEQARSGRPHGSGTGRRALVVTGRHCGATGLHRCRPRWGGRAGHLSRVWRRSCAGRIRRCTPPSRGPSGSTRGSRRPRNRTRSTAAISPPGRRACRSRSTYRPIAGTTPTIRGSPGTSAWPGSRSTPSTTCGSCSSTSRWTPSACP